MALYFKRLDGKPQAYRKGCGKADAIPNSNFQIPNSKSAIGNPKSEIRNPKFQSRDLIIRLCA
jgi:hypothetical protein